MPGPSQIITPGKPFRISAAAWNAGERFRQAAEGALFTLGAGKLGAGEQRTTVVLVKNNSGTGVRLGGALGIDGPLIGPTENPNGFMYDVVLKGITPVPTTHASLFVVAAEAIPDGEIGRAYIAGCFWARVSITAAGDTFARPKASVAELETSGSGAASIVYKESGTGSNKWALLLVAGASSALTMVYTFSAAGTAGTESTEANWNYTIASDEGGLSILATGVLKETRRPVCPMLASRDGKPAFARRNAAGTWVLIELPDEAPATFVCVP